jgi:hypothetical protein
MRSCYYPRIRALTARSVRVLLFLLPAVLLSPHLIARRTAAAAPKPPGSPNAAKASAPPVIVVGFVGGWVHDYNLVQSEVQLAMKLRTEYPSGLYAQIFENHKPRQAYRQIMRLLDTDRDGSLSPRERERARIILYGHSFGGSEAVTLARRLQKENIPVLLTIMVDSVQKPGEDDSVIPANVSGAANFYQPHGIIHGRSAIRAADPTRTTILGNFRFDYTGKPLTCGEYSWWDRHMARQHTEIECDPTVWGRVENLIREAIAGRNFASPRDALAAK